MGADTKKVDGTHYDKVAQEKTGRQRGCHPMEPQGKGTSVL